MDKVGRSRIDFYILWNRFCFCVEFISFIAAKQIKAWIIHKPINETHHIPHDEFDDRPKDIVQHRLNNYGTDILVPLHGKV
jgi:hypothetical protein